MPKKILSFMSYVFLKNFQDMFIFSHLSRIFKAWKFIFSFFRVLSFSRMRGNPVSENCTRQLSGITLYNQSNSRYLAIQAIPENDQNVSPTNQKTAGSKLGRTS